MFAGFEYFYRLDIYSYLFSNAFVLFGNYAENSRKYHTVELQLLEHLGNHEKVFETGVVRANESLLKHQDRRHNKDISLSFSKMKVCCVFSLASPRLGDSTEYTQHVLISIASSGRF